MPRYEYRCRACGATFEKARPLREAGEPAACPHGHSDTVKMLSTVAVTGRAAGGPGASAQAAAPSGGGGCCGGGCCGGG